MKGVEAAMEEAKEEMKAKDVEQTIEVPLRGRLLYLYQHGALGPRARFCTPPHGAHIAP